MGHKVHPYGFRLGVTRTWTAKWYADKDYTALLKEDLAIRRLVETRLANASVSGVEIERGINHVTVTVHTAKPGIIIGQKGAEVDKLRKSIQKMTKQEVFIKIQEVRRPDLTVGTVDHSIPTFPRSLPILDAQAAAQVALERAAEGGVPELAGRARTAVADFVGLAPDHDHLGAHVAVEVNVRGGKHVAVMVVL